MKTIRPISYTSFNKSETKLLLSLLQRMEDEFANHGCNDFDLIKDGNLTPQQARSFLRKYVPSTFQPNDITDQDYNPECQADVIIIGYFVSRLKAILTVWGGK